MAQFFQALISFFISILMALGLIAKPADPQPEMKMTKVCTVAAIENLHTLEGGCTDGRYIYQTLIDPDAEKNDLPTPGRLVKIDVATMRTVMTSDVLYVDHANDVTYNSKTKELIISNNIPNYTRLTFVDPETLTVKGSKDITSSVYSVVYVGSGDFYYAGISKTFNVVEMDADFNVKDSFGMNEAQNVDGIVRQTLETDGKYIYSVFYKPNSIYKYSVDGEFIGKCTLPIAENEAENIFFIGDSIYVSYNILGAANGGEIYKLENPVFEK